MEFVDLSRELFHRTHRHPSHPPVIITTWSDHSEKVTAGNTVFSSKALSISFRPRFERGGLAGPTAGLATVTPTGGAFLPDRQLYPALKSRDG